ncbi:protein translocase subunit SecE [Mycobacterium marinum]|uniref:preprotein translocase subunit SecE n=1 Tax=Mycobacterium marinum TaxID=1781 RepID=UPI0021C2840A|nr:preprotein translocase subunit SecE [Mycobacterium marinum]GJN95464.1 protein translocase subunit SecE [Mycobacterium marinum]GJO06668.1 protein translocase subunit SecE [Mycobacterium marinum]GJO18630.1 protein translocase subunit SecE [Mycobacterium marinum]GJO31366.1 protein translocase subunit SecE [Mycobacterium marinum]GJO39062.1 protein translocase subunit SecE [Mycobacterium marinum]
MSDEGDAANDATSDGGATEDDRASGGLTALVTKSAVRPQRPTGKRSRQRATAAEDADDEQSSTEAQASEEGAKKDAKKETSKAAKAKKPKTASKPAARAASPFVFVYNYLKQVVAEMRKVIWPNRKQMLTYTSVVLVFLAFMVALVGSADLGLSKLMLLVFG